MNGARNDALRLAASTFGILVLELALIRWMAGQIRLFAYFNNLVLIAGFLGMGLGVALARTKPALRHLTLPALLCVGIVVASAERVGLTNLAFPDVTVALWGSEVGSGIAGALAITSLLLVLFWAVAFIFVFAGAGVGVYFRADAPLRSYTADLVGSLLGVLAFAAMTALWTTPPVWILLGGLPFLAVTPRWWAALSLAGAVGVAQLSVGDAMFSPYNRITVVHAGDALRVDVNRDFHQFVHDLSDFAIERAPSASDARFLRTVYDLPFVVNPGARSTVIVGGGTGNDVAAALRHGYERVVAVDIDPRILALGKELHPEHPYDDPRVERVTDDARAFFEQYDGPPFDTVCYGLLDSHAMFSALSTLRLENYVYTQEGLEAAWAHVSEHGHLALSFSVFAGDWISDRIYWTLAKATHETPFIVNHGMHYGRTFVVAKDPIDPSAVPFSLGRPTAEDRAVRTTSDDWPFLYIRPGSFPWGYVLLLSGIGATAAIAVRRVFAGALTRRSFDVPMFAMGAAFLLLETRAVTNLSLLFGSTWIVNAFVFAGILAVVLVANLAVTRWRPERPLLWFVPLLVSLMALGALDVGRLEALPLVARGMAGSLLAALPVGFAGVIVSTRLGREGADTTAALGSNLLGAVLGGALEYLGMVVGLRALVGVAAALYLVALLAMLRSTSSGGTPRASRPG